MSILVLDDMDSRHREFRRLFGQVYEPKIYETLVHHVDSAEGAMALLSDRTFVQVFLDHDLSEEDIMVRVGESSKVPTGMEVVDFICGMEFPPGDIVIHSCNGPAAVEMERRLRDAHGDKSWVTIRRVPFPHLIQLLDRAR